MFNPLNEIRNNNIRIEAIITDRDLRSRVPIGIQIGEVVKNFLHGIEQYIVKNCITTENLRYGGETTVISGSVYVLSEQDLISVIRDAVAYGRYGDKQYPNLDFSPYSPDNGADCHVRVP